TGNVWTLLMKQRDVEDKDKIYAEVKKYLLREHGVDCIGKLGFENAYAIAVPEDVAPEMTSPPESEPSLKNFAAWAERRGGPLRIDGDNMIFDRPEWVRLRRLYGLNKAKIEIETLAMDPTLMYRAIDNGQVDAIVAYTSDGRIPANKLEILKDPQ